MTTEALKHKASDSVAAEAAQIIRTMYNQIKTCSYCLDALQNIGAGDWPASDTDDNNPPPGRMLSKSSSELAKSTGEPNGIYKNQP
jgi:hypothetical protein